MKIAIFGSGFAGMFAALRLAEENDQKIDEITIFEKNDIPGGMIASHIENGYNWDKGVFIFPNFNLITKKFPDLFEEVQNFSQKTYINGQFRDMQQLMKDNVKSLSTAGKLVFVFDYCYSYLRTIMGFAEKNLYDWIRYRVTKKLYPSTQLETYLRKLQGLPTKELSAQVGWQRISYINLATRPSNIIKSLLKIKGKQPLNPVRKLYPFKHPVSRLGEAAAKLCQEKGINIIYDTAIVGVSKNENGSFKVTTKQNEAASESEYTHIISTIPLKKLVSISNLPLSDKVKQEADSLRSMHLDLIHFALNFPLRENEYVVRYSFDSKHKWKRAAAIPFDIKSHCLTVEVCHLPGELTIDDKLLDEIENQLITDFKLFTKDQIIMRTTSEVQNAYPIYENGFEKKVRSIRNELETDTFQIAGRQGQFAYLDSYKAIEQGEQAADNILRSIGS